MDSTVGFRVSETNWFSCGAARRGKGLMAIFLDLFASTSKIFVLVGGAGHWAIILWGLGTSLIFPKS